VKIPVLIDGRLVHVEKGTTVIEAAVKAGVEIPTLCHHRALRPYGACRLCMVEIAQKGNRRLVTSCNYPVEPGMEVLTDTVKVKQLRKMLVELLLARCPGVPVIQNLARRLGLDLPRMRKQEDRHCILCGLCVRYCEEVVGASAIGLSNRGTEREVTTPFRAPSDSCIGCGSCTYICPAGCIEMEPDETAGRMTLRMGDLALEPCPNHADCEQCDIDRHFLEDAKNVLTAFRNKVNFRSD
jgi:heterodisulfide reductase subunit A